ITFAINGLTRYSASYWCFSGLKRVFRMVKRAVFSDDPQTIGAAEIQDVIEQRARQLADSGELGQSLDEEENTDELRALAEIDGAGDVTFQVHRLLPASEAGFVGQ